ncbi:MAG: outer membrane protein assembly factor BamB family protein [Caulobacteraceae bacterium]
MRIILIAGAAMMAATAALTQTSMAQNAPAPAAAPPPSQDRNFNDIRMGLGVQGEIVFNRVCSACHKPDGQVGADARAPHQETLRQYPPERIYEALSTGKMQAQGAGLSDKERQQVAEWLSGRGLGGAKGEAAAMKNRCDFAPKLDPSKGGLWNGWSPGTGNGRYQDARHAGLTAADLPKLKLKWAFGIPGGVETSSQPTVYGQTVFFGSDAGNLYAVDSASGCVHWSFLAGAGVRSAPLVVPHGPSKGKGGGRAVVFGDYKANLYAVDASTGALLWQNRVDDQALSRITGAAAYHDGLVYVGTSSSEEISGLQTNYECCRMRGTVNAVDAETGKTVWKFYTIPKKAEVIGTRADGRKKWGPAGLGVWSAPTIDAKRGVVYVTTGDSFTVPAEPLSDSIVALGLKTGKLAWSYQATRGDSYMTGCSPANRGPNCPESNGPDYDFGSSVVLTSLPNGKEILVGGHKGGAVLALDPDRKGKLLWSEILGSKMASARGDIVFGGAVDHTAGYYALQENKGVASIDLKTGRTRWILHPAPPADRQNRIGSAAAVTLIPGVMLNGGWDGILRAYATADGQELWRYDTVKAFDTVNGVPAKGGSMGAPGATVAGGMLFVGSGYIGTSNGMPGNVMLAFAPE